MNTAVLSAVQRAAQEFVELAIGALGRPRLAEVSTHVVIRCSPPRARLLLSVEDDDAPLVCAYQLDGAAFPPALGSAVARLLESVMAQLSPAARVAVAQHQDGLGVIVERAGDVVVMVDVGAPEPMYLARFAPQPALTH